MTYTVDGSFEETPKYPSYEYKRYGLKFEPRQTFTNNSTAEPHERLKQTIRQIFNVIPKSLKRVRRDEPELCGLIFTASLKTLENYITGPPRRPFHNPSGNFVIIISKPVDSDGGLLAAHILRILWRDYRILHIFILASCEEFKVRNKVLLRYFYYFVCR